MIDLQSGSNTSTDVKWRNLHIEEFVRRASNIELALFAIPQVSTRRLSAAP
jgi:hypothetical protein